MSELVGYCGIPCTGCPAYQATLQDDNVARRKIAEEWSRQFKITVKPEDINCNGCTATAKRLSNYCFICEIRKCGLNKHLLNCGYCEDYPCDKLDTFHVKAPQAKLKLESIRNKNNGEDAS